MTDKSKTAYRNIRETAEILGLEVHVLRFWETKFDSLQPMTRGGGRRYYSPEDIAILETIKDLLYNRGLTIKAASGLIDKYGTNAVYVAPAPMKTPSKPKAEPALQPATPAPSSDQQNLLQYEQQLLALEKRALQDIARLDVMLQKLDAVA